MKTNETTKGGSLQAGVLRCLRPYFVKYIQGMKADGMRIDAMTVQNEPLHPGNNPSLLMLAAQQAEFIGKHLGPAFRRPGWTPKSLCYDHNADRPDYPITCSTTPRPARTSTARPFTSTPAPLRR